MRFYGISSEDALLDLIGKLPPGEWIFEDVKEKRKSILRVEEARRTLKALVEQVIQWKRSYTTLGKGTVFVFVHEPQNPRAFKIYDPSSLGCSTSLTPPRWKLYLSELGNL